MYRSFVEGSSKDTVAKFEKLVGGVNEDIAVVRDRVPGPNVVAARERAESRLKTWSASVLKILKPASGGQTESSRRPSSSPSRATRRSLRSTTSSKWSRPMASITAPRLKLRSQRRTPP